MTGTNESDDDTDGVTECAGDCDDGDPDRFPGNPEICDGIDNDCSMGVLAAELDVDLDGLAACEGDCDDSNAATYPGAPEINDGSDNQCPGNPGYGVTDEISGTLGINGDVVTWPPQAGASLYQLARATAADFTQSCTSFITSDPLFVDPDPIPPVGESYFYMVRAIAPFLGSWGVDTGGVERSVPCAP